MKILLILPRDHIYRYHGLANKLVGPYAPLTLVTLAALVPAELHAQIDLLDEGIEDPNRYRQNAYDVVGITAVSSSANRAYQLADYWRKRGALVVLGGPHPTLLPNEAGQHADAVVIGLAEETWPQLLRDFKHGVVQKQYQARYTGVLSCPPPRRDLFPRLGYFPVPTVIANRGCSNHCIYCVVNQSDYSRCVVRPIPEVIEELRGLKTRMVMFLDPNLVSNQEYAMELFEALIPLKLRWLAPMTCDVVYNRELFDLMLRSGCQGVLIGFESFSQDSMNRSTKRFNQVEKYKEIVKIYHQNDVVVSGCFVLGFDEDPPELLEHTAEIVYDIQIDFPRYALLTPFPGSYLFQRFKRDGRLITEDWSLYDSQHVVFEPKQLTPVRLQQIFNNTIRRSFSYRHILHRARVAPHSKLLSLLANWGLREALFSAMKREAGQTATLAKSETGHSGAVDLAPEER